MKRTCRSGAVAALLLAGSAGAHADSAWQEEATIVVWASGLDGRESIGPITVNVDASFRDLAEFVDAGGALRYTAHRADIGWFIEASYVQLEDQVAPVLAPIKVELGQTIAEAGISWDATEALALYGGARYQALDLEISHAVLGRAEREQDWIDAIAGLQWTPFDRNGWSAWLRADVGAGGSDFQWLGEAGVKWRFARAASASLAYRTLDTDYESGRFAYDMRQSGLLLGLAVHF